MASYFDRFGPVPKFSSHAWRRLNQRGLSPVALQRALDSHAKPGTSTETVVYSYQGVTAVVNATTGLIVTVW
jgi:hypothetical protein